MSTYVLSGHDRTTIDVTGPLQVRVVEEGPPGAIGVLATRPDGSPHPADRPAGGVLILRAVDGCAVIRVVPPPGSTTFAAGVRAGLRVRAARGGSDEVAVRAVDVSGLAHRDLVSLETVSVGDRDELAVTALDAVAEVPIGPLQAAARGAARSALGVDRLPESDTRELVAVVDPSASMAPALADGSVEAAVDVLAGLALVIGRGRTLRVCIAGQVPAWLPEQELRGLGATVVREIVSRGLECGFRPAFDQLSSTPGYLVTDGVPAAVRPGWHVLAIGSAGGDGRGAPCTALPPPRSGRGAVQQLLDDPALLHGLLRSLVAPSDQGVPR